MDEQFYLNNPDWRNQEEDEEILLDTLIAKEKDIYLAIELMTPYIKLKHGRYPTIYEIEDFIMFAFYGE